jgi:Tol biopolymer transport system component/DNA-binding winged helix-turn-helix (wHTH) protein
MPGLPKASWRPDGPLRIGEYEALPVSNELRGAAGIVRLRPLIMEVLLRLAAEPGTVVTRERLIEDVWPRRMVNDEVLSRAIAELRTALGDDARQSRYIETIPKVGYRLVAPVAAAGATLPIAGATVSPEETVPTRPWLVPLAAGIVLAVLVAGFAVLRLEPEPGADLAGRLAAAQPLTADVHQEQSPRFAPEGDRVAFVLREGSVARIAVQPVDGGARRLIGEADATHLSPVFFPDGRRLAFWRLRGGDCAIVEYDLDSGRERPLLDCALRPSSRFDLSPDGKWLAITATAGGTSVPGIVLVEIATGAATPLGAPEPGLGDDVNPRFSPDGRRVAFFRGSESHRRLWIAPVEKPDAAREVSTLEGLTYGAAWLGPEGPLVVAADWFGFRALVLVDPGRGTARLLGARGARYPDASARGDVVYENAVFEANLWLVETGNAQAAARVLWPSTRYTSQPEFSPDGRRVAFVSNRDGNEGIYVARLDGEPLRLPLPAAHRYIRPHWSPDGLSLYAVRIPVGAMKSPVQHGVRISIADGRIEVLEQLGAAVGAVRPSADGRWLYAGEVAGQAMRLVRAPVDRSFAPERLPLPPVAEFQLNAAHLVFTQPGMTGATSCRLADLTCEPLDIALDDATRHDWMLAGRSIYFPVRGPGTRLLARFDLEEGRLAWRRDFAPTAFGLALAASPDESLLVVAREAAPAIDIMIARAALSARR